MFSCFSVSLLIVLWNIIMHILKSKSKVVLPVLMQNVSFYVYYYMPACLLSFSHISCLSFFLSAFFDYVHSHSTPTVHVWISQQRIVLMVNLMHTSLQWTRVYRSYMADYSRYPGMQCTMCSNIPPLTTFKHLFLAISPVVLLR